MIINKDGGGFKLYADMNYSVPAGRPWTPAGGAGSPTVG